MSRGAMTKSVAAVVAALVAASHAAHAQTPVANGDASSPPAQPVVPERFLVGAGFLVGGDASLMNAGLTLEVGLRIPNTPLFVRVEGSAGSSGDVDGKGDFRRGVVGLELRRCPSSFGCVFAGVGIGYQRQSWSDGDPDETIEMIERHDGALVTPRVGAEVGGRNIRFRIGVEVHAYNHHDNRDGSTQWQRGWAGSLGLAYRR
jgi:hypothetical protein